jgi:4-hydroxythreonine-4-phosphate dehydrogenase
MMQMEKTLPRVGVTIGDPCGIGPEVVVKALTSGVVHAHCRPVLIGSLDVVAGAVRALGLDLEVRRVQDPREAGESSRILDVIDPVPFDMAWVRPGYDVKRCGWATGKWLAYADQLARDGALDATAMAPISSVAMKKAGTLQTLASHPDGGAYLLLRSGPLMIAHLTDHVPLRAVPKLITQDAVFRLIRVMHDSMCRWGCSGRRIAVAGVNPHADGREERKEIEPAVDRARADGIDAVGPVSPDSVFRQCVEGRYDVVIAMYHDQGHIAIKTWGFSGNSVVFVGLPYVHTTVAHGVAYELAGKGLADHQMMLNAILNAADLAAGEGFYQ